MTSEPTNDQSTKCNTRIPAGVVAAIALVVVAFLLWNGLQRDANPSREPRITYLAPDENGLWQLFVAESTGSDATQLTYHAHDMSAYAIAPDGNTIAYALPDDNGGSAIWLIDPWHSAESRRILACPDEQCANPVWSPVGDALLIERAAVEAPDKARLWWLTQDGTAAPLFDDDTIYGKQAQFSPDGEQIAFFDPSADAIFLYNQTTGANVVLPTTIMTPVVWHPDGEALLFRDMQTYGERFGIRMLRYDVATGDVTNLTVDMRDDELPAIWTEEDRIIFGRKRAQTAMGRQILTIEPDGTIAALTADADVQHSTLSLSPDQTTILMQQFNVKTADARPGVWLLDRDSGVTHQVIPVGIQPQWLP